MHPSESVQMSWFRFGLSASLTLLLPVALWAQDFNTLIQKVMDSPNVVTMIDMAGLKKSNLARSEGWDQKQALDYYSGRMSFPPTANLMVLAAHFNPMARQKDWNVGLAEFSNPIDMYAVAKKEGSEVDWIEKVPTVPSRRNAYFMQFEKNLVGMFSPANRQQAARWVREVKENKSSSVPKYLTNAVNQGGAFGQVVIAFDMANLVTNVEARTRLFNSKVMTDAKADLDAWTKFVANIQGLSLAIKVDNDYTGQLKIDFSDDVKPYAELLQPLVMESLMNIGFSVSDIGGWKTEARGKSFILTGSLDKDDVKRIMALVLPSMPSNDLAEDMPEDKKVAITSQRYVKAVNTLITDLRARTERLEKTRQYNDNAAWHDYVAQKIDQLPNVNTDPDVQKYAGDVTAKLHMMSESLRGVNIQNKVVDTYERTSPGNAYGGYSSWGGYYGGGFGGSYSNSNWKDIASQKAENAAKGAKDRLALWREIDDATSQIRKVMSDKYKIEF